MLLKISAQWYCARSAAQNPYLGGSCSNGYLVVAVPWMEDKILPCLVLFKNFPWCAMIGEQRLTVVEMCHDHRTKSHLSESVPWVDDTASQLAPPVLHSCRLLLPLLSLMLYVTFEGQQAEGQCPLLPLGCGTLDFKVQLLHAQQACTLACVLIHLWAFANRLGNTYCLWLLHIQQAPTVVCLGA